MTDPARNVHTPPSNGDVEGVISALEIPYPWAVEEGDCRGSHIEARRAAKALIERQQAALSASQEREARAREADICAEIMEYLAEQRVLEKPEEDRCWEENLLVRSLAALSQEAEPVAWRCHTCHAPRSKSPCHKCGGELTRAADGWEEPALPPIDRIRELAREKGYGLGVHGSLERDLDLIAVPWVEDAARPGELASHIAAGLPGRIIVSFHDAPHGRVGFNIKPDGWFKMIDLSVMHPDDRGGEVKG